MTLERPAGQLTWVERAGRGVRRALFIHCSLAHSGAWRAVMARLERKLAMTAFDLPGHGRSGDWDGVGDYQSRASAIAAGLIERRADVIGHSFGATIALRLARDHPDKVRSLTLIEPVLFAAARDRPEYGEHQQRSAPFEAAMRAENWPEAARLFDGQWGPGTPWEALPARTRDGLIRRIPLIGAGAGVTNDDVHGQLAPGALEALDLPVLLIEGSASPPVIGAVQSVLAARLPDARRVIVAGAGHMAPISHPQAVAGEIAAFLKM